VTAERVCVGLIGCGGFLRAVHLPHLLASDLFRVAATCDVDAAAAESVREQAGAAYATSDVGRLLADPGIDAVVIATRHDSHAPLTIAAARAGKHILCEKPMGLDAAEFRAVADAVRAAGVVYTIGYNRGMAPLVVRARELLASHPGKRLLYHRLQAPFPPSHWTHLPAVGGGRFVGEGCHIFDLLCELAPAPPAGVYASGGTFLDPASVHIPDSGIVTLTFADGSVATTLVASDGCARFPKESTEIYADGTAILIDDFRRLVFRGRAAEEDVEVTLPAQDKGHTAELEAWGRAILYGAPAPNPLPQALRAALISVKVLESLSSGRVIPIAASEYAMQEKCP